MPLHHLPRYTDLKLISRVINLIKIANQLHVTKNIVHFELELQLQEFMRIFKSNVLCDSRVTAMARKIIEERKEEDKADDTGLVQDKFNWSSSLKNPQLVDPSKRESILMNAHWGACTEAGTPGPGDRLNKNASRNCRFKL